VIRFYSGAGDLVLDPFAGIGTVPARAVAMGRRGYGVELEPKYWRDSLRYLMAAEFEARQPTLFDVLDAERNARAA
jgi:DNA modification methylase